MRTLVNSKGLSPIFAALIMLGIVTVLFIPIFVWSTGLTTGTQSFWERSGLIATERVVIEEVNLKGGSSDCTIYVRNIGKTSIVVADVFVSDEFSGASYQYKTSQFATRDPVTNNPVSSIVQGELLKVYVENLGFTATQGRTYVVKVFTERGVGDIYQVKA